MGSAAPRAGCGSPGKRSLQGHAATALCGTGLRIPGGPSRSSFPEQRGPPDLKALLSGMRCFVLHNNCQTPKSFSNNNLHLGWIFFSPSKGGVWVSSSIQELCEVLCQLLPACWQRQRLLEGVKLLPPSNCFKKELAKDQSTNLLSENKYHCNS